MEGHRIRRSPKMMMLGIIALCFSGLFLILFLNTKKGYSGRYSCLVAFLIWILYAVYEGIYIPQWMKTITGAPIRADLVLFFPILAVVSIIALIRFMGPSYRKDPLIIAKELLCEAQDAQREGYVEGAVELYAKLIDEFPSSDEAKLAKKKLQYLRGGD